MGEIILRKVAGVGFRPSKLSKTDFGFWIEKQFISQILTDCRDVALLRLPTIIRKTNHSKLMKRTTRIYNLKSKIQNRHALFQENNPKSKI